MAMPGRLVQVASQLATPTPVGSATARGAYCWVKLKTPRKSAPTDRPADGVARLVAGDQRAQEGQADRGHDADGVMVEDQLGGLSPLRPARTTAGGQAGRAPHRPSQPGRRSAAHHPPRPQRRPRPSRDRYGSAALQVRGARRRRRPSRRRRPAAPGRPPGRRRRGAGRPGDQPAPADGELEQAAGQGHSPGGRPGPGGQGQPGRRPGQRPRRLPGQRPRPGAPHLGQVLGQPLPQVAEPPVHANGGQVEGEADLQPVAGRLEPPGQGDVLDQRPGHGPEPAHGLVHVPPDEQALPGQEGGRAARVGHGVRVQPLGHLQAEVGQEQLPTSSRSPAGPVDWPPPPRRPGRPPAAATGPRGRGPRRRRRRRASARPPPPPPRGRTRPPSRPPRVPAAVPARPAPRPRRLAGRAVGGPVVHHHHLDHGGVLGEQRRHAPTHRQLVPRRHDHTHRLPQLSRVARPQPVPASPGPPQPGKAVATSSQPGHPGKDRDQVPDRHRAPADGW